MARPSVLSDGGIRAIGRSILTSGPIQLIARFLLTCGDGGAQVGDPARCGEDGGVAGEDPLLAVGSIAAYDDRYDDARSAYAEAIAIADVTGTHDEGRYHLTEPMVRTGPFPPLCSSFMAHSVRADTARQPARRRETPERSPSINLRPKHRQ